MLSINKEKLLSEAKKHLTNIREKIEQNISYQELKNQKMQRSTIGVPLGDAIAQMKILAYGQEKIEDLKQLHPSPYFAKCLFKTETEERNVYVGKFSFSEQNIYSWITPVAALRFENTGPASYTRQNGTIKNGTILEKEQYLINDGKILFFSQETIKQPRELIYQEHFTQKKPGFVLKEVVEQMEKAQDQVIRIHYHGPLVITGPAGSGKTTLALHRVAYLIQSPETTNYFTPDKILILVQDSGTKKYFSNLLPELGIKNLDIFTFSEWAQQVLSITEYTFIRNHPLSESENFSYQHTKLVALRKNGIEKYNKNIYSLLSEIYTPFLNETQNKIWEEQKKCKTVDRFDLTILLGIYQKTFGNFQITKEYYEETKTNTYRKKKGQFRTEYNLMILDEFQNYLPEQITILKGCLNNRMNSIVYVGDMAQKTLLGTINNWSDANEQINSDRIIKMGKVYRNTKQILQYIRDQGYDIAIPEELKTGDNVKEIKISDIEQTIEYLTKEINDTPDNSTVGILTNDSAVLTILKKKVKKNNIFVFSFQESQGVEFDNVYIVE
ncbi:MAG: AAA family ATPase, partial [bacterium]|nr:AAA family ATPase [bacterium]